MKANELMLGDWILYGEKPVQVLQLTSEKIYRGFYPIPLTPEILERNGFEIQEQGGGRQDVWCGFGEDNENDIEIEFEDGAPFHIKIDGNNFYFTTNDIHYVHELQHALRLCGIDKEIVL